jgi:hypothetical protein
MTRPQQSRQQHLWILAKEPRVELSASRRRELIEVLADWFCQLASNHTQPPAQAEQGDHHDEL